MAGRMPEIFIVGVMKGATTILYDYLATHPRVAKGSAKELHYFSLYTSRGHQWYMEQFPERPAGVLALDASPTYFDTAVTPCIPGCIKAAVPDARIILTVRDPIERAVSHFQHLRQVSHKEMFAAVDVNEFFSRPIERAYQQLDGYDFYLDQVLSFSLYYRKLTNYIQAFGRGRILVLQTEDLRANSVDNMRRVFDHCGLDWASSDLFGQQRYLSGSQQLRLDRQVHDRLADLFYGNYCSFCRAAGVKFSEKREA